MMSEIACVPCVVPTQPKAQAKSNITIQWTNAAALNSSFHYLVQIKTVLLVQAYKIRGH
jgi:hypothetical protein